MAAAFSFLTPGSKIDLMRRLNKHGSNSSHSDPRVAVEIGYLFRCCEESIAAHLTESRSEVPFHVIAAGVAELLARRGAEVREGLGSSHLLPGVWGSSTTGNSLPESLEMGVNSSDRFSPIGREKKGRGLSESARRKISRAQRKRWANYRTRKGYKRTGLHWTQKPENRARMEKVLRKMARARKALAA